MLNMLNIVERKKPILSKHVNITNHAYERFLMRVENSSREKAKEWVAQALNKATYVTQQEKGREVYVFKEHKLVIDKHLNIITIMSDNEADWESIKDTRDDISDFIKRKLNKEVRPLIKKRNDIQIKIYEKEISKIKTKNPNTKDIIQEQINSLIVDKDNTNDKLIGITKTAKKYYLEPEDVHKDLIEFK